MRAGIANGRHWVEPASAAEAARAAGALEISAGPFEHAEAHVRDLESFVESIPEGER